MNFWKKLFGVKKSSKAATEVPLAPAWRPRISSPIPPDSYTSEQGASFRKAASDGSLEEVKVLLEQNPDLVFSKDDYREFGITALHHAASEGHKSVAELLLARKAKIDVKNAYGLTPLRLAVSHGHKDVVVLLLANNANVNDADYEGDTPLHTAVRGGQKDIVELLLANKARVDSKNKEGTTPLQLATNMADSSGRQRDKEMMELLRQHSGHE